MIMPKWAAAAVAIVSTSATVKAVIRVLIYPDLLCVELHQIHHHEQQMHTDIKFVTQVKLEIWIILTKQHIQSPL
jgi:hypothetical protein